MSQTDAKTVKSSGHWTGIDTETNGTTSASTLYYSCNRPTSSEETVKTAGLVGSALTRKRTQQDLYGNIKEGGGDHQDRERQPKKVASSAAAAAPSCNSSSDEQTSDKPTTPSESTTSTTNTTTTTTTATASPSPAASKASTSFIAEPPDWTEHKTAWGYLQALRKDLKSGYLDRQQYNGADRTGYLLGRYEGCDFVINKSQISKRHCLIYVENGNDGHCKGISVYLEDLSSNGTFVNGKKVGRGNRVLLRSGDRIQLYRNHHLAEDDPRNVYYRLILPPVFEVGTFHEEYVMQGRLGKGSFASVYKAVNKKTERVVAVKVLQKSRFASRPKLLPSIIQEVGILMSLEAHPGVIQIEKVYNEPKYIYLILEYVQNGEFFDYLLDRRQLAEHEARFVMWQLFLAIQFLHDRGIAHRDLKPENVLLVNKQTLHIKVTDFGLAKVQYGRMPFSSQCGTPNYVAPEVLEAVENRAYGKECDLWSLGVMLYVFLSGYPPFNEDLSPPPMKEQIKQGLYSFSSSSWDGVSDEAKDLVQRLLTVDPIERITIEEALVHPWMQMDPEATDNMRSNLDPSVLNALTGERINLNLPATQSLTQSMGSFPY